jgi:hypothetical protein
MKLIFLLLSSFCLVASSFALVGQTTSTTFKHDDHFVLVEVEYLGEPVDLRRELRAVIDCFEERIVILHEEKECDFKNISIDGDTLSFETMKYNVVDGTCSEEGEKRQISLKNRCR